MRIVTIPTGPAIGNSDFASDAPLWTDTMAATTAAMGRKERSGRRVDCTQELYRVAPALREASRVTKARPMATVERLFGGNHVSRPR